MDETSRLDLLERAVAQLQDDVETLRMEIKAIRLMARVPARNPVKVPPL